MDEKMYTILTKIGIAKHTNAAINGTKIEYEYFVVGDGNGNYPEINENQTELVNEVWRTKVRHVELIEDGTNQIRITALIPPRVGGFIIREVGIIDNEGDLIAVGRYPLTWKPSINDGAVSELTMRMIIQVSNSKSVELKIDPTIIHASLKDLNTMRDEFNKKINDLNLDDLNLDINSIKKSIVSINNEQIPNLQSELKKVKQSGVESNKILVDALNSKKILASTNDDIKTNIKKINDIKLGSGNAINSNVLKGKTFSSNNGTNLVGTMPNNGSLSKTITTQNGQFNIPKGYTSGGTIKAQFNNLLPSNIKKGINIGGIVGNFQQEIEILDYYHNASTKTKYALLSSTTKKIKNNDIFITLITSSRFMDLDNSDVTIQKYINGNMKKISGSDEGLLTYRPTNPGFIVETKRFSYDLWSIVIWLRYK